jgi:hypothetical protein
LDPAKIARERGANKPGDFTDNVESLLLSVRQQSIDEESAEQREAAASYESTPSEIERW